VQNFSVFAGVTDSSHRSPADIVNTRQLSATMQTVRARLAAEPRSAEAVRASAGLDILRGMPGGRLPMGDTLNFRLVEAGQPRRIQPASAFEHYNPRPGDALAATLSIPRWAPPSSTLAAEALHRWN
jgi:hypothetical protein